MKYFTPELFARGNSLDVGVVRGVESDWEIATKRYRRRSNKIKSEFRRLENMVLLKATKNSLIGNSTFAHKKIILKDFEYKLTSDVAANRSWGVKEIAGRQKNLASLAVKTWPLDV